MILRLGMGRTGVRLGSVVFYCCGVAWGGGVGVLAKLGAGAALAEQVPELVELDLQLVEARAAGVVEVGCLGAELVFFGDQLVDVA